jgi:hypothetical protein
MDRIARPRDAYIGARRRLLGMMLAGPLVTMAAAAPVRKPKDAPFVPTPDVIVRAMLDLARVGPDDVLYDLGSGDGRIVIAAARRGARAVGVEIDAKLVEQSIETARTAGVAERTRFLEQDLFATDLREATVVTLYLLPGLNMRLKPKLLAELRPGSRVVSHSFHMGDWDLEDSARVAGARIVLYVGPARRRAP